MKKIEIRCEYDKIIKLEELGSFQGGLKRIDKERFNRIKNVLMNRGFIYPIYVWIDRDNNYIIDGVHRLKASLELRREGYKIDGLPVVLIDAPNKKKAKEYVLLASNRYARYDKNSLIEYMSPIYKKGIEKELGIDILDKLHSKSKSKESGVTKSGGDKSKEKDPKYELRVAFIGDQKQIYMNLIGKAKKILGIELTAEDIIMKVFEFCYNEGKDNE